MNTHHVCPAALAGALDNRLRHWLQDPGRILRPFLREGMTALDLGCGPGFFTVEMAGMVGSSGRVVACDLQQGMLDRLRVKISGTTLEERVTLHRCEEGRIGWTGSADFILAFYVIHEIPDHQALYTELLSLLHPDGLLLVVEPPLHVSARAFNRSMAAAEAAGLRISSGPKMLWHKTALLTRP